MRRARRISPVQRLAAELRSASSGYRSPEVLRVAAREADMIAETFGEKLYTRSGDLAKAARRILRQMHEAKDDLDRLRELAREAQDCANALDAPPGQWTTEVFRPHRAA